MWERRLREKHGPEEAGDSEFRELDEYSSTQWQTAISPGKRNRTTTLCNKLAKQGAHPAQARRPTIQAKEAGDDSAIAWDDNARRIALQGVSSDARPLPYLARLEAAFPDQELATIRAHIGGPAARACERLGAVAYATGEHIAFRKWPDLHTVVHELTHVLQQRSGIVLPEGRGRVGDAYERQADQVADHVVANQAEAPASRNGRVSATGKRRSSVAAKFHLGVRAAYTAAPTSGNAVQLALPEGSVAEEMAREAAQSNAGEPRFEEFAGDPINKPGRISSPAQYYNDVVEAGKIIRDVPAPSGTEIARMRYDEQVYIRAANKSNSEWAFVVSALGPSGWIQREFLAESPPDPLAKLYHIKEGDRVGSITHEEYSDKYSIRTGDDHRILAAALYIANRDRSGVTLDEAKYNESLSENWFDNALDPWNEDNRAIYQSIQVEAGKNIWLPGVPYIQELKDSGIIDTRPDWMNAAIDIGKGTAGFVAGILSGFFGGILEALEGLYELVKEVINLIGKIITGDILNDIQKLYDEISNLTVEQVGEIINALLSSVMQGLADFADKWNHSDAYECWFFRGKVVGAIALEVVLAIFTGGAGNAAKWAGRLGKYLPRLSRLLKKAITKVDNVIPDRLKKKKDKDRDRDDDEPGSHEKVMALGMAKTMTETQDARNGTVRGLMLVLRTVKQKYKVVKSFTYERIGSDRYQIWMIASKHKAGTMSSGEIKALDDLISNKDLQLHSDNRDAIMEVYDPDKVTSVVNSPDIAGVEQDVIDVMSSGAQKARKNPNAPPPIDIDEVIPQVRNHHDAIAPRGYPHLLSSVTEFKALGDDVVRTSLRKYGIGKGEIRLQGSSVRKLDAADVKDLDVAVLLDKGDFDDILARMKAEATGGKVKKIDNGSGRGFLRGYDFVSIGSGAGEARFVGEVRSAVSSTFGRDIKVEISLVLKGGPFDLGPYLDVP